MHFTGRQSLLMFIGAAALVAVVAPLFQRGLFIDGLLYQTVATNFARGDAGFWQMKFTGVSMNPFCEQPPLFFAVAGTWMAVFGISDLSYRAFALLLFLSTLCLAYRLGKTIAGKQGGIGSVFLLLCIPVFHWSFVNAVVETLVTPLTLCGLWVFIANVRRPKWWHGPAFACVVVLLFLSKGFQSCFVTVLPLTYLVFNRTAKAAGFAVISTAVPVAAIVFFMHFFHPSAAWFDCYLHKRLIATMHAVGATTSWRLEIVVRFVSELLVPILIVAIAAYFYRRSHPAPATGENRMLSTALLLTALSGSLPFAITLEQRGFYLVPSFPFIILWINVRFKNAINSAVEQTSALLSRTWAMRTCAALLAGAAVYCCASPWLYKRDKNLLSDIARIDELLHPGDTLSIDDAMWNDTALQAYLYMSKRVCVDPERQHRYYLHDEAHDVPLKKGYRQVHTGNIQYALFERYGTSSE